jgi:hypothetical protein
MLTPLIKRPRCCSLPIWSLVSAAIAQSLLNLSRAAKGPAAGVDKVIRGERDEDAPAQNLGSSGHNAPLYHQPVSTDLSLQRVELNGASDFRFDRVVQGAQAFDLDANPVARL